MRPEPTRGTCLLLLILAAFTLPCAAQDQEQQRKGSPFDLIPAGTHLVVSVDGPAALAKKFAGTRVLKLLGSDAFGRLLEKHWKPLEPTLKKRLEEISFDLDDLKKQLAGYSGKMVLALHLGDKALDFEEPPKELSFTLVLGPDGKTPLGDICKKLSETIQEKQDDHLEEVEFEGRTFLHMSTGGEGTILVPFMHRQHLCWCVGSNAKDVLRRVLNPDQKPTYRPPANATDKGFFLDINLGSFMGLVRRSLQQMDEDQDSDWTRLFDDLGGRSPERLESVGEARPPFVVQTTRLQMNDKKLGVFAALFPEKPGRSPLSNMLPGDIQAAALFFLSLPRLHAAAKSAFQNHADLQDGFASMEEGFETMFELRLKEDVLDHVGGHVLYMEHAPAAGDDEDEADRDRFNPIGEMVRGLSPYCVAVSLKDAAAFGASLEKILRKRGLHAARKTRDYKGLKVHTLKILGVPLHYAITSRAFLVALGKGGGIRAMHSALDCEVRATKGEAPLPLRKEIADRVAIEPGGCYGIGYDDLIGIFRSVRSEYDKMQETMEEYYEGGLEEAMRYDSSLRLLVPLMKASFELGDLLKPAGLETTATVLRYKGREILQSSIW